MTRPFELVDEAKRYAHANAGRTLRDPEPVATHPLVPLSITVPDGSGGEVTEEILWRLGDPAWEPKGVAGRLCQDLNLPPETEKLVEDQIVWGLKNFTSWKDLGGDKLVRLQLYVRRGSEVFQDDVLWNVNNPCNTSYAYAARVCGDLSLDFRWFEAINSYVQMRLDECIEDLLTRPTLVELVPPSSSVIKPAPPAGACRLPRVEPFDGTDAEAFRALARGQRLQQASSQP